MDSKLNISGQKHYKNQKNQEILKPNGHGIQEVGGSILIIFTNKKPWKH